MERDYTKEARLSAQRRHEEKILNPPSRVRPARRKRSRRTVGTWAGVTLLSVFLCALGFLAYRLVVKIAHPYREMGAQSRWLSSAHQQVAALDTDNTALRQKIAFLKTPSGMAQEARKMGYVRTGEIPFVVEGLMPSALPAAADTPRRTPAPAKGRAVRLWHRLTGH